MAMTTAIEMMMTGILDKGSNLRSTGVGTIMSPGPLKTCGANTRN